MGSIAVLGLALVLFLNSVSADDQHGDPKFAYYRPKSDTFEFLTTDSKNLYHRFGFDSKIPTRFFIHDSDEDQFSNTSVRIRMHYDRLGSYNKVIVGYPTGYMKASEVGAQLGQFLVHLIRSAGMQVSPTIMIGDGYGAQIAEEACRWVLNTAQSRIGMIVALDPGIGFENQSDGLGKTDAETVVVFHTNVNRTGTYKQLGTVDIYANDQTMQPECQTDLCSHKIALDYFMNVKSYPIKKCKGIPVAEDPNCPLKEDNLRTVVDTEASFKDVKSGAYWMKTTEHWIAEAVTEITNILNDFRGVMGFPMIPGNKNVH